MSKAEKRIVVLISGSGTNMVNIAEHCEAGRIAGDVVAVISNKANAGGLQKAEAMDISTAVLEHTHFDSREAYDDELAKLVDSFSPDVIVLAGFMRILSADFVRRFTGKLINIHPSLLPKYKGMHTHQRALEAGDKEHGVSVHFVNEELDGGPVILQARIPIFEGDTAEDLQERVHEQEYRIYPLVINWLCLGRLKLTDKGAEMDGQLLPAEGYAS